MAEPSPLHLLPIDSDNSFSAHATVTADGSALLACNYGGGSCVIIPLNSTGLFPVSTTDAPTESSPYLYTFPFVPTTTPLRELGRQESSHPHQLVQVSAEDREFWVNDLGQDKVWKLRVVGEGNDLSWESAGELELTGDEGGGPRHSVVSEHKHDIYVINELFPTLTHSRIATSDADSTTTLVSKTSMIPPPPAVLTPQNTTSSTAELLLLPTTPLKTLVGSTRQLAQPAQDALGMFDLNEDGLTQFVFPRQGRDCRGVGASQDGKYVVAAGQADGWVSVFGKNSTGSRGRGRPGADPFRQAHPRPLPLSRSPFSFPPLRLISNRPLPKGMDLLFSSLLSWRCTLCCPRSAFEPLPILPRPWMQLARKPGSDLTGSRASACRRELDWMSPALWNTAGEAQRGGADDLSRSWRGQEGRENWRRCDEGGSKI